MLFWLGVPPIQVPGQAGGVPPPGLEKRVPPQTWSTPPSVDGIPPPEVWTDRQTENITFPNPSDAGGNNLYIAGDDPELIDALVLKLSRRINSESDLRDLATLGLGVRDPTIGKNLHNKKDINEAAYQVIMHWRTGQDNDKIAYVKLCEALRDEDVGMASYIKSVLEPTWNKMQDKM